MKYILDASVALKWFLPERESARALQLREDTLNQVHELHAPDFFPTELTHSITRAERQGRISPTEAASFIADLLATMPDLHSAVPLISRAYDISSTFRQGAYDCVYVALAEREGCELVTADDKLVKKLKGQFPFITELASLP